ncbi:MAG: YdcF family protein [Actinomycetota bacterium]|nr:YdcF family protein [Actinomycetota bacterium]
MRFLAKLILVLIAAPFVYLGWTALEIWETSRRDERPRSDAIVVLGAAQYDGKPSAVFRARLDHARNLYNVGVAPLIVVLGGKRAGDRFTEAQAGAAYLEKDLPANRVTGVKAGSTTLESLRLFTGLAHERGIEKIVVVSDPLHLRRAKKMAEDLGFEVAVSPSPIAESVERRRSGLLRETATLAFYRLFHQG